MRKRLLLLLIPIAVALIIWFIPSPIPASTAEGSTVNPAKAWHLFAIFAATIVGIIAKALPMGAMCMVGMGAVAITGTLNIGQTLSGFQNTTIWLIVMAFFISRGVIKTGLGRRIALFFVSLLGKRTLGLAYGLALTDLALAPATPSNTARAGGIVMPIMRSIASSYGSEPDSPESARKVGAYLTQTAYIVNCITSAMFLTAMAGNPLAQELASQSDVTITWGNWAIAAIVPGLVMLVLIPLLLYKIYPPTLKKTPEAAAEAKQSLKDLGPLSLHEWLMAGTIILLLVLWVLSDSLGVSATTTALVGLGLLLILDVLNWEDVKKETAAWDTLVWFAALVMMATFLNTLGLIPWLSKVISDATGGLPWTTAFIILALLYFFSHYLFASNTAHISAMYAAFLGAAIVTGAPPLMAALILGFISNLFAMLTHYGAGPAPVLFGTGYVPMGTWWRNGLICAIVTVIVWGVVGGAWMKVLGMW